MTSEVEYRENFNYLSHNDKDIPYKIFCQIFNEHNNNKCVRSNINAGEISLSFGIKLLKIFKDYPQKKSFL